MTTPFHLIISRPSSGPDPLNLDDIVLLRPQEFTLAAFLRHIVDHHPRQHRPHLLLRDLKMQPLNVPSMPVMAVYAGSSLVRRTSKLRVPRRRCNRYAPRPPAPCPRSADIHLQHKVAQPPPHPFARYIMVWVPFESQSSATIYKLEFVPRPDLDMSLLSDSADGLPSSSSSSACTSTTSLSSLDEHDDPFCESVKPSPVMPRKFAPKPRPHQRMVELDLFADDVCAEAQTSDPDSEAEWITAKRRSKPLTLASQSPRLQSRHSSFSGVYASCAVNPWGLNKEQILHLVRLHPIVEGQPLRMTFGRDAVRKVCLKYLRSSLPGFFVNPMPFKSVVGTQSSTTRPDQVLVSATFAGPESVVEGLTRPAALYSSKVCGPGTQGSLATLEHSPKMTGLSGQRGCGSWGARIKVQVVDEDADEERRRRMEGFQFKRNPSKYSLDSSLLQAITATRGSKLNR